MINIFSEKFKKIYWTLILLSFVFSIVAIYIGEEKKDTLIKRLKLHKSISAAIRADEIGDSTQACIGLIEAYDIFSEIEHKLPSDSYSSLTTRLIADKCKVDHDSLIEILKR